MDLALKLNDAFEYDLDFARGDLVREEGLRTSVLLSLFTDSRAESEPLFEEEPDPRGWWAESLQGYGTDRWGSLLWSLAREKSTEATRVRAEEYATRCLQWAVSDGIAAAVSATAQYLTKEALRLFVTLKRPDGEAVRFELSSAWAKELSR